MTEEEFSTLRELMQTTDSALSRQLATLADAGYVGQRRAARGGRSRVWAALTDSGRRAFRHHLQALTALADSPQEGPHRP